MKNLSILAHYFKEYRAFIVILACVVRVGTNMFWPFANEVDAYFIGQAIFEVTILIVFSTFIENLYLKSGLQFFTGFAVWALVKEFNDPVEFKYSEYIGFLIGIIFFLIQLLYGIIKRTAKRVNK